MYPVEKIEETDDEVIVCLGAPSGSSGPLESGWNGTAAEPTGYPLPTIGLELARLGVRWQDARLGNRLPAHRAGSALAGRAYQPRPRRTRSLARSAWQAEGWYASQCAYARSRCAW